MEHDVCEMILFPPLLHVINLLLLFRLSAVECDRGTCPAHGKLPGKLLVAYGSWSQCDAKMVTAAEQGANVLMWFSINLSEVNGTLAITGALPDLNCVANVANTLQDKGLEVTHVISVGGWNAPLPSTKFSGAEWFRHFDEWNKNIVARHNWGGFDGIDWDVEGNDSPGKNVFTMQHMDLIGEMSVYAKRSGYIVSMAPAQSYLDVAESHFELDLTHSPTWKKDFPYHGRNLYAYWLAFYGETLLGTGDLVPTFDWVGLQLYEGWSRANYEINVKGVGVTKYLSGLVRKMDAGWEVDFGKKLGRKIVKVPKQRLVIGLANGWTKPYPPLQKFLLLMPKELGEAWREMKRFRPRGFMFWTVAEEGKEVEGKRLFLVKSLSEIINGTLQERVR